jgi:hypothetical protein
MHYSAASSPLPPDVFRMQVEALLDGALRLLSLGQVRTVDAVRAARLLQSC